MVPKMKPVHPGQILKEGYLKPFNISIASAARTLGISRQSLSDFINGKTDLSPEMAKRLSLATNADVEYWMRIQNKLDIWKATYCTKQYKIQPFELRTSTSAH